MGISKAIVGGCFLVLVSCGGSAGPDAPSPAPPPVPSPTPSPVAPLPDPGPPQPSDNPDAPPSNPVAPSDPASDLPVSTTDTGSGTVVDDGSTTPPDTTPPDTTPPDDAGTTTTPPPAPRIVSFQTTASCVTPGDSITLTWVTTNAASVTLDGAAVKRKGSKILRVDSQQAHTLRATSTDHQVESHLTIYLKMLETYNEVVEEPFNLESVSDLQASADGTLLALSGDVIYKGSRGENFDRLNPRTFRDGWTAVAIDPNNSDILYAARTGRIYHSTDGGATWPDVIPIRRNNRDLEINAVTVAANRLFVGFAGGGFKVDLSGPSLNLMSDLNTKNIVQLEAKGTLAVATDGYALFRSTNTGGSWETLAAEGLGEIRSLNIHSGTIYASAANGLYAYNSGWSRVLDHSTFQSTFMADGTLYAATADGVFKKNGDTWENTIPQTASWLFEDEGLRAVSGSAIMGLTEHSRYSDMCPLQLTDILISWRPHIQFFYFQTH